jgi:hypothetical protein
LSNPLSVPAGGAYRITAEGKLAWRNLPTCKCCPKLDGLLITCQECGTVFGTLRDVEDRLTGKAAYK